MLLTVALGSSLRFGSIIVSFLSFLLFLPLEDNFYFVFSDFPDALLSEPSDDDEKLDVSIESAIGRGYTSRKFSDFVLPFFGLVSF